MADQLPKFKNQKDSYKTEEERFALLQEVEAYVQSQTSDDEEQKKKRRQLVRDNPDIFYPLYKDYELSPKRKAELESLADTCSDRLSLSPLLMRRLTNYQYKDEKDRIALCQDIVKYLVRDSGTKAFQTDLTNPINVVVKPMEEGLSGYRRGNEIGINQNDLKLDGDAIELFDTLSHETLHAFQKKGQANFTELSALYYVSSSTVKGKDGWKGKTYQAYQNQPIEKEAWFFGSLMGTQMTWNAALSHSVPKIAKNVIETLTGENNPIEKYSEAKLVDGGQFQIPFSGSLNLSSQEISHFFDSALVYTNPGLLARGGYVNFKMGENETAEQFMTRLSTGTERMKAAISERDQFKQKIQTLFPNTKPVNIYKGGIVLDGANPEVQQWIRSMGTNVSTTVLKNGNLSITMPLILQKDGKDTSYTDAFREQYTHLTDPKGLNYRVLMGGDKKPIIPKSLKERLNPETKTVSNHDLLRGAANGGQGQGGEPPMDKHNGLDYRDVGGKDRKPEIPAPERSSKAQEDDAARKRAEEIRRQLGWDNQIAARRGHSL